MNQFGNEDFKLWLVEVMKQRPKGNYYLDCPRGMEVGKLCIDFERDNFSWRRSDADAFWIDVQMFVKYKLTDEEIIFTMKMQPGVENYKKHADERNAYAEYKRGLDKLRAIAFRKSQSTTQAQ